MNKYPTEVGTPNTANETEFFKAQSSRHPPAA